MLKKIIFLFYPRKSLKNENHFGQNGIFLWQIRVNCTLKREKANR